MAGKLIAVSAAQRYRVWGGVETGMPNETTTMLRHRMADSLLLEFTDAEKELIGWRENGAGDWTFNGDVATPLRVNASQRKRLRTYLLRQAWRGRVADSVVEAAMLLGVDYQSPDEGQTAEAVTMSLGAWAVTGNLLAARYVTGSNALYGTRQLLNLLFEFTKRRMDPTVQIEIERTDWQKEQLVAAVQDRQAPINGRAAVEALFEAMAALGVVEEPDPDDEN